MAEQARSGKCLPGVCVSGTANTGQKQRSAGQAADSEGTGILQHTGAIRKLVAEYNPRGENGGGVEELVVPN